MQLRLTQESHDSHGEKGAAAWLSLGLKLEEMQ
jgi:hypothetical protein